MDPILLKACNRANFCTLIDTAKTLGIEMIKGTSRGDASVFIRESDAIKIIRACRDRDIHNVSKGETSIMIILEEHYIVYEHNHSFKDCKYINSLPFDFYLRDCNVAIEYQGEQHFRPVNNWNSHYLTDEKAQKEFEELQTRDKIKKDFCEESGIILLTPDYTMSYKEIEELILDTLGIETN